jgi:hypothetical protein
MTWTKEKPTGPGYYWHVDEPGDEPAPCLVFLKEGTLSFISIGWSMDVALAHIEGLFYGPIEMPEGPERDNGPYRR